MHEMRHDAFQHGIAVGRGQAQLKSWRGGHERPQFVVGDADDLGKSRLVFEPRALRRIPESRPFGADGLCGHVPTRRYHAAEQFRGKGNPAVPCARGRNQKEAQLLERLGLNRSQMRVFCERIAQRRLVVHEKTDRLGLQLVEIEARGKADLHRQAGMLCVRRGAQRLGLRVVPFLDPSFGAEPRGMMMRVVSRKARHGGDAQDARGFIRRATVKIVFGQAAHQTVAPEQQRQRFDDSGFAAVVRPHQHGMTAQRNVRRTHAPEAGNRQTYNVHPAPSF